MDAVRDLVLDATGRTGDDRTALPHRLRHGQAKALVQTLLHDDRGVSLQRVDDGGVLLGVGHWQVHEMNSSTVGVRELAPGAQDLVEDRCSLRIVGHRVHVWASQDQLGTGRRRPVHELRKALHDAQVVLQRVPARDLHDQWDVPAGGPAEADDVGLSVDSPRGPVRSEECRQSVVGWPLDEPGVYENGPDCAFVQLLILS